MPRPIIDLTGERFGRLVVLGRSRDRFTHAGQPRVVWKCQCDCGKIAYVASKDLRYGYTRSCGCWNEDNDLRRSVGYLMFGKVLEKQWKNMMSKCYDETNRWYPRYGGAGIGVCDEWKLEHYNFARWALDEGFDDGSNITRIDNTKGFSPDNLKVSKPHSMPYRNKDVKRVASITGLPPYYVYDRIRNGLTLEQIVDNKFRRKPK